MWTDLYSGRSQKLHWFSTQLLLSSDPAQMSGRLFQSEWVSVCVSEWVSEWVSECVSVCVCVSECVSVWVCERVSEWECVSECLSTQLFLPAPCKAKVKRIEACQFRSSPPHPHECLWNGVFQCHFGPGLIFFFPIHTQTTLHPLSISYIFFFQFVQIKNKAPECIYNKNSPVKLKAWFHF